MKASGFLAIKGEHSIYIYSKLLNYAVYTDYI